MKLLRTPRSRSISGKKGRSEGIKEARDPEEIENRGLLWQCLPLDSMAQGGIRGIRVRLESLFSPGGAKSSTMAKSFLGFPIALLSPTEWTVIDLDHSSSRF